MPRSARRDRFLVPGFLILASVADGCGSPSAPSNLRQDVTIAGVTFTHVSVFLGRDFMPIVVNPGPDGGRPLGGVVELGVRSTGPANQFTLQAAVYDSQGRRYPLTATPHDADRERQSPGQPFVWDGTVARDATLTLRVVLSDGPYLAVDSRVYVVLELTGQGGQKGALRTAETRIVGTY